MPYAHPYLRPTRSKAAMLALALALGALALARRRAAACAFSEASPGVFRCQQRLPMYSPAAHLLRVQGARQLTAWHWVLVDAAVRNTLLGPHADGLVRGVRRHLGAAARPAGGKRKAPAPGAAGLELVVLTHGHVTGALPGLLKAYPDAVVVVHEAEEPMLAAGNAAEEEGGAGAARRTALKWPAGMGLAERLLGCAPARRCFGPRPCVCSSADPA
jgi:hypothetical protein